MSTRFFTNHGAQTLFAKFEGVFASNKDLAAFDALVGYLRSSGWFAVRPFLEHVPEIRVLVGINVDSLIADYQKRGLLFHGAEGETLTQLKANLLKDIEEAEYSSQVEKGILKFIDDVATKRIQVRAHPTKNLHAKIYIFRPDGFNEHRPGAVITGSSNLTEAGLGIRGPESNYEFNVLLHDYADVMFATDEFEALWKESVDVLPKDIKEVAAKTYLGTEITPYQLYHKLLIEYFGRAIDYDPNATEDLPKGFKRLSYQVDAVTQGVRLLQKHNGFFLADVVGLGKTVIATLIARKFFFHNGFPDHRSHTLIVVPPALEENWEATRDQFHLDNVRIVTNGSLHKVRNAGRYDLIIVDEAHRFRNDASGGFDLLQRICKTDTRRIGDDGKPLRKKVILISATPLNNRPADLRNLIALFQDLKDSTLNVHNLQRFFAAREKEFLHAKNAPDPDVARREVKDVYELIREKVMSEIIVRRTRRDLSDNAEYKQDLDAQDILFPEVAPPRRIFYPLPPEIETLYDRTMSTLATAESGGFTYNRYRAIQFLKPEIKANYTNADLISHQLATIMRVLLVKRLDSSFHAFRQSLRRFRDATRVMATMFEKGAIYIAPNLKVTEYLLDDRESELLTRIEECQPTDPTISICTPDDFEAGFLTGLLGDLAVLEDLCTRWEAITEDPKLDTFLRYLKIDLFNRDENRDGKLVVFSESKETTTYLTERLNAAGLGRKILTVDAANRAKMMPLVRANFDANHPLKEQSHDYDIIVSTEVLAEGVNLHRANVIVNYDTPWNSTRLMQRIGRVNRIGTNATCIYIYNFYPTSRVDDDIELRKKAILKLQAFHSALGEDSQIYSPDEEVDNFGLFDKSPEEAERDERLSLLMELRKFRDENPEEFRRVKQLPLRARVGRSDNNRAGSSVIFIRDARRDGFFRVGMPEDSRPGCQGKQASRLSLDQDTPSTPSATISNDDAPTLRIEEISIVEAAREFRAPDPDEPTLPLPDHHHGDVRAALAFFRDRAAEAVLAEKALDHNPGPNERRALEFLDAFLKLNLLSDSEKDLIRSAKLAVRKAKFQQLQKDLNKLQKSVKQVKVTPSVLADKLIALLHGFPLEQETSHQTPSNPHPSEPVNTAALPKIILSESFVDGTSNEFDAWLKASVGVAKGKFTTDEMMRETRGED
ncbi:MAG: helicase-related protein [Verrucomicrobiota bacterium]